ncbi:chaperone protein DnaJ-like isoform X2 [Telopea speciosissima]|uniref:chaperone protein DnaJ-like isoform X2 n=1 Tax=Telopea speciosissima TaxID=54955 RepID=UPI001CC43D49|nr:chaperone protein DnaJ-like isoform X2 [Telopea speciosissima]
MMWEDLYDEVVDEEETAEQDTYVDFDFFSELTKPKQWHPDKRKDEDSATSRFQEINEAYRVLSDPMRRKEYDKTCMLYDDDYNIIDYLNQYKSLILTCSGLGIRHSIWGSKESRHGEPL